jgi:uncharacterized protein
MIPSRTDCICFMERVQMPLHIQFHSMLVADVAVYLGTLLNDGSPFLNIELLEAGGLLHDIAKPRSIATGERHEELGATMLEAWGYPSVAPIVKEHVTMDATRVSGPITESILVNYADKRVRHAEIVSIEDRFQDLIERYAKSNEQAAFLEKRMGLYFSLEERIFENLSIHPTGEELMSLRVAPDPENGEGGNGKQRK